MKTNLTPENLTNIAEAAAREIYSRRTQLDEDAGRAACAEQDDLAGLDEWCAQVARIVERHFEKAFGEWSDLLEHERELGELMHRNGIFYNDTFTDGIATLIDQRNELQDEVRRVSYDRTCFVRAIEVAHKALDDVGVSKSNPISSEAYLLEDRIKLLTVMYEDSCGDKE